MLMRVIEPTVGIRIQLDPNSILFAQSGSSCTVFAASGNFAETYTFNFQYSPYWKM